jgi:hypothetical protein
MRFKNNLLALNKRPLPSLLLKVEERINRRMLGLKKRG